MQKHIGWKESPGLGAVASDLRQTTSSQPEPSPSKKPEDQWRLMIVNTCECCLLSWFTNSGSWLTYDG